MKVSEVQYAVSGGRLAASLYEPDGPARPYSVVGLHGFALDRHDYSPFGERFAARGVAASFVDMRAHGESAADFEIAGMAGDALAVSGRVKEETKKPVVLFGHSLGAYIAALAAARDEEERLAAVVMMDIPSSLTKYTARYPAYRWLSNRWIIRLARSPAVLLLKAKDRDIGRAAKWWQWKGDLRYYKLTVRDAEKFKSEIDSSPDVVEGYRNGFRTAAHALLIHTHDSSHNDKSDSIGLAGAMRPDSKRGRRVFVYELDAIGGALTPRVAETIVSAAVGFLDPIFGDGETHSHAGEDVSKGSLFRYPVLAGVIKSHL